MKMQWPLRSKRSKPKDDIASKENNLKYKSKKVDSKFGEMIDNRFLIQEKLGSGSFGEVRLVLDTKNNNKEYAAKMEHKSDVKRHLETEYNVYSDLDGCSGFPRMIYFGKWTDYTVLIMDRLGSSLKSMYTKCDNRFSTKTVSLIGIQMLDRLEKLHNNGWLHQDIKPENIVVGYNSPVVTSSSSRTPSRTSSRQQIPNDIKNIFCLDFGTSNRFIDPITKKHVIKGPSTKIVGTARYSSLNNHYGQKQSRRDDLESLGYTLIYWMIGRLPWQGINERDFRAKWRKVRRVKRNTTPDDLCHGLPVEFCIYMKYVFKLSFSQRPNYSYLRGLFRRLIEREEQAQRESNQFQGLTGTSLVSSSSSNRPSSTKHHHDHLNFDWQKLKI